jgi:hypothetical protein
MNRNSVFMLKQQEGGKIFEKVGVALFQNLI